ncbi:MAG: DUF302 domain-containing protein [Terriglobia bacterium]
MLYRIESRKTLREVASGLEAAAQRHKFGVIAVHDLKAKMNEKGVDFDRECLIYEVCNPHQAKKVLEANAEVSTALPCRISVYSEGAGLTLATLRPTALIDLFNTPALKAVAQEVEEVVVNIMNEAA